MFRRTLRSIESLYPPNSEGISRLNSQNGRYVSPLFDTMHKHIQAQNVSRSRLNLAMNDEPNWRWFRLPCCENSIRKIYFATVIQKVYFAAVVDLFYHSHEA